MADPIRVLIVDDEERFRETLAKLLGRHGFVVREAGSGPAALELLGQAPCDVIVLDVKMPGMDGMETLSRIKQAHPTVEVIMLTGHGDLDLAIQSLKLDATDFLTKPVNDEVLNHALRRAGTSSAISA